MHMRTKGDVTFRDLNKNGKLDPYEDPRCPIEEHRPLPRLRPRSGVICSDVLSAVPYSFSHACGAGFAAHDSGGRSARLRLRSIPQSHPTAVPTAPSSAQARRLPVPVVRGAPFATYAA